MNGRWLVAFLLVMVDPATSARGGDPYRFEGRSQLPLVVIDTSGREIPDEPKIGATLSIIDHDVGKGNGLRDRPTTRLPIAIEVRGTSSQFYDKKTYGLETRDSQGKARDVGLLGMPKESAWILYGPQSDKTLMRNVLAYHLSHQLGHYAPRTRFVEVFLRNSTTAPLETQYVGVYLLTERLKRGRKRIDVRRLRSRERTVSGGYVLKIDRVREPATYFTSSLGTLVGHVYPRGSRLDPQRRGRIVEEFDRMERVLAGARFDDPEVGYRRYLHTGSWVDYILLSEFLKNVDAYILSTYFHKAKDGKIHMGPLWDFNLSSGNACYGGVWHEKEWILTDRDTRFAFAVPFWWDRLLEDPQFRRQLVTRWRTLRKSVLQTKSLIEMIDHTAGRLQQAQRRNFQRWPLWNKYVWPNPRPYAASYDEAVSRLKEWLRKRGEWMDANIETLGRTS